MYSVTPRPCDSRSIWSAQGRYRSLGRANNPGMGDKVMLIRLYVVMDWTLQPLNVSIYFNDVVSFSRRCTRFAG